MQLSFQGQLSREEFLQVMRAHYRVSQATVIFRLVVLALGLVAVGNSVLRGNLDLQLVVIFSLGFVFLLFPLALPYLALTSFSRNPNMSGKVSGTISEQSINLRTETASSTIEWNSLRKLRRKQDILLLYHSGNTFNFFLKRFFRSEKEWKKFIDLAESKVSNPKR